MCAWLEEKGMVSFHYYTFIKRKDCTICSNDTVLNEVFPKCTVTLIFITIPADHSLH